MTLILAPEQVINALLKTGQDEQGCLLAAFHIVQAKAEAMVFTPHPADPDRAEEQQLFGEIVTEKYRRQGFNL